MTNNTPTIVQNKIENAIINEIPLFTANIHKPAISPIPYIHSPSCFHASHVVTIFSAFDKNMPHPITSTMHMLINRQNKAKVSVQSPMIIRTPEAIKANHGCRSNELSLKNPNHANP